MKTCDVKRGMMFECKETLGIWYTKGKTYTSMADHTIRDNTGFDYDVLYVDKYFKIINDKSNVA